MTVLVQGQPALRADPLASQRVELLGRVAGAQLELEKLLATLRASGTPLPPNADAQLSALIAARQEIATARPGDLPALQGAIAALVASANAVAQDGLGQGGGPTAGALAQASENARQTVNTVMAGMKDFDPYLRFASAEDERTYREREEQRRHYIAEQEAKGTAAGNLNAANAAVVQMEDAGAHGASASPEYSGRLKAVTAARDGLRQQLQTEPQAAETTQQNRSDRAPDGGLSEAMAALAAAGAQTSDSAVEGHGLTALAISRTQTQR